VVAAPAAWARVREACPPGTTHVAAADLPGKGWFAVKVITLGGRGVGPVGYLIERAGKTALFSGRIPVKVGPASVAAAVKEFRADGGDAREYRDALRRLGGLHPDLWLPAVPVHAQNTNVYDRDWEDLLAANEALLY
jgi:hypothetical protein